MDSGILFAYGLAKSYTNKAIGDIDISGEVAEQLPSAVDDYLSEHIDPETGYVLDNSLTLENAAAQAKAVGDALSQMVERNEIVYHKANFDTSYDETYVNNGYIESTGTFRADNGYRTYYLKLDANMSVYLEKATSYNSNLSLAIYSTSGISRNDFVARYRTSDNNMPSKENRLALNSGQWVAVTIYASFDYDFNFGTNEIIVTPTNSLINAIVANVPDGYIFSGKVTKTATSLFVYIGNI